MSKVGRRYVYVMILCGISVTAWGLTAPSMMPHVVPEPLISILEKNPKEDWHRLIADELKGIQRREYIVLAALGFITVLCGAACLYFERSTASSEV